MHQFRVEVSVYIPIDDVVVSEKDAAKVVQDAIGDSLDYYWIHSVYEEEIG